MSALGVYRYDQIAFTANPTIGKSKVKFKVKFKFKVKTNTKPKAKTGG
jgi:hypothetical protein